MSNLKLEHGVLVVIILIMTMTRINILDTLTAISVSIISYRTTYSSESVVFRKSLLERPIKEDTNHEIVIGSSNWIHGVQECRSAGNWEHVYEFMNVLQELVLLKYSQQPISRNFVHTQNRRTSPS